MARWNGTANNELSPNETKPSDYMENGITKILSVRQNEFWTIVWTSDGIGYWRLYIRV